MCKPPGGGSVEDCRAGENRGAEGRFEGRVAEWVHAQVETGEVEEEVEAADDEEDEDENGRARGDGCRTASLLAVEAQERDEKKLLEV